MTSGLTKTYFPLPYLFQKTGRVLGLYGARVQSKGGCHPRDQLKGLSGGIQMERPLGGRRPVVLVGTEIPFVSLNSVLVLGLSFLPIQLRRESTPK